MMLYDRDTVDFVRHTLFCHQINGVRIAINIAVGSENSVADWGPDAVIKIQRAAREKLLRSELLLTLLSIPS